MKPQLGKRRLVVTVGLVISVLVTFGLDGASGAAEHKISAGAAARACSMGRSLPSRLGAADVSYVAQYLPCVLRNERTQAGLGYRQSPSLSASVHSTLGRFVSLAYLKNHNPRGAVRATLIAFGKIALGVCHTARGARFIEAVGDTNPPPVMTPLEIAKLLARSFGYPTGVARARRATFGTASHVGLLFMGHDLGGSDFGMVAVVCPNP